VRSSLELSWKGCAGQGYIHGGQKKLNDRKKDQVERVSTLRMGGPEEALNLRGRVGAFDRRKRVLTGSGNSDQTLGRVPRGLWEVSQIVVQRLR